MGKIADIIEDNFLYEGLHLESRYLVIVGQFVTEFLVEFGHFQSGTSLFRHHTQPPVILTKQINQSNNQSLRRLSSSGIGRQHDSARHS